MLHTKSIMKLFYYYYFTLFISFFLAKEESWFMKVD